MTSASSLGRTRSSAFAAFAGAERDVGGGLSEECLVLLLALRETRLGLRQFGLDGRELLARHLATTPHGLTPVSESSFSASETPSASWFV